MLEELSLPHFWCRSSPTLCTKLWILKAISPSCPPCCPIYLFCSLFWAHVSFVLVCWWSLGPASQLILELPEHLCIVCHGTAVVPESWAAGRRAGIWTSWKNSLNSHVEILPSHSGSKSTGTLGHYVKALIRDRNRNYQEYRQKSVCIITLILIVHIQDRNCLQVIPFIWNTFSTGYPFSSRSRLSYHGLLQPMNTTETICQHLFPCRHVSYSKEYFGGKLSENRKLCQLTSHRLLVRVHRNPLQLSSSTKAKCD